MGFKRILAAVDFSEGVTEKVVEVASDIARCNNAELFLIYVVEKEIPLMVREGLIVPSAETGTIEKIFEKLESRAMSRLSTIATEAEKKYGVKPRPIVETGEPFDEIIEKAHQLGADLIVVGAHSKSGIERLLLGSVSERVARKARTSVMIVRLDDSK